MKVNNTTIEVVRGSVIDQTVDAIVNAANTSMRGGGGIDGRIHSAAGPGLLEELKMAAPDGAKTGTAVITGAHKLPHKHIIHTPGPRYRDGESGEDKALETVIDFLEIHPLTSVRRVVFAMYGESEYEEFAGALSDWEGNN